MNEDYLLIINNQKKIIKYNKLNKFTNKYMDMIH